MKIFLSFLLILLAMSSKAQHQHNMPGMKMDTAMSKPVKQPHHQRMKPKQMPVHHHNMAMSSDTMMNMQHHDMSHEMEMKMEMPMPMNHSFSLNLPMNRNSSGTSWLPDVSPMYGYMVHSNNWMY